MGAGSLSGKQNIPERVFAGRNGEERVRIGAEGFKASVPYVDSATSFLTPGQGGAIAAAAGTSRVVLTPAAEITSLFIEPPPAPANGQLFHVSVVARPVSGITWPGHVVGAPASAPAGHTMVFQFSAATQQWLCVEQ